MVQYENENELGSIYFYFYCDFGYSHVCSYNIFSMKEKNFPHNLKIKFSSSTLCVFIV